MQVPKEKKLPKNKKLRFPTKRLWIEKKQIRRVFDILHFTESLDNTKVIQNYLDWALKNANPNILVLVCSHK